jgi:hypothetical protein
MPKLRVHSIAMSLDGYAAGPEVVEHVPSASVTHVVLARQGG